MGDIARCNQLRYTPRVIVSFRHKGLKRFFESGDLRGIPAQHGARIRRQPDVLDAAREVKDLNLSGWKMHQLKGARRGTWVVSVSGNWRITFRFEGGDAYEVELEDYHS
jgi:proteic killer suppression protein